MMDAGESTPGAACLVAVCLALLLSPGLQGATFEVDSTLDDTDVLRGDGVCATGSGLCTLRAAVQEANYLPGADEILLPEGAYDLSYYDGSWGAGSDNLNIYEDLVVRGAGMDRTIVSVVRGGTPTFNVFSVSDTARDVTLSGMSLEAERGIYTSSPGTVTIDGCRVSGGSGSSGSGLYIDRASGTVTLVDSFITGNEANRGGGIRSTGGVLRIIRSTISANHAREFGSALWTSDTDVIIRNSTVSLNTGWNAIEMQGPSDPHTVAIYNSTIIRNQRGIYNNMQAFYVGNSVIAQNIASFDIMSIGETISLGHNLLGSSPGNLTGDTASNLIRSVPMLGSLQDNGGPTPTHAPLAGSPIIDAGDPGGCMDQDGLPIASDQRGVPRPFDGDGDGTPRCDIGAVEMTQGLAINRSVEIEPGAAAPPVWTVFDPGCRQMGWRLCPEEIVPQPLSAIGLPFELSPTGNPGLWFYQHADGTASMLLIRSGQHLLFRAP